MLSHFRVPPPIRTERNVMRLHSCGIIKRPRSAGRLPGYALVFVSLGGCLRPVVMLRGRTGGGLTVWVRCRGCARLFRRVARICRTALLPVGLLRSRRARGALGKASTAEC
jgi:hypothetical protein